MDDFFSDNFFGFGFESESDHWSERDWIVYIKHANSEIEKILMLYNEHRKSGMSLEDIANMGGWPIAIYNSDVAFNESSPQPEFSKEPLTLINHPIYVVSQALIKALQLSIGAIVKGSDSPAINVWNIAKSLQEASTSIIVAVNSTDLGEDMLAHSYYKAAIFRLNSILAEIEHFDDSASDKLKELKAFALTEIFDLRQMCLNLS